jgi:hypothetical protein
MTVDKFLKAFKKCPGCKSKIGIEYPLNNAIGCVECYDLVCTIRYDDLTEVRDVRLYKQIGGKNIYCQFICSNQTMVIFQESSDDILMEFDCDEATMIKLFKRPGQIEKYLILI